MKPRDFFLLVVVCLVWASNNILSKIVVSQWHVPPLFFTAVRFAIVVLATLPWLLPMPRPAWRILLIGLAMGGGSFGLMFIALYWVSPSEAAIVVQACVPMTTLLSIFMLGERIRWRRTLGITLALIGVLMVAWKPGMALSTGMLFLLASAFMGSLGAVMMKQMDAVSPLRFQAWVGLTGLLVLAPFSLWTEPQGLERALATGWPFVIGVLYAALITSVFAHTAYYWLIARYEANLISALTLMTPLMTIVLGMQITGDKVDARMIAGSLIALAGVLIIILRTNRLAVAATQEHS